MADKTIKPHILIAEDEEAIITMLQYNLEHHGFKVSISKDGEEALVAMKESRPDVVLLDWMMPNKSGIEVCEEMRHTDGLREIPVIMLTARGEESDRVQGLDSGADDYMVKPFSPNELVARINAVLRRTRPVFNKKKLEFEGVKVDIDTRKVFFKDKEIHLGPTEFRLLAYFMERPNHVMTREHLLDAVWGYDIYVELRTVDVHIRRLRRALSEAQAGLEEIIKTVRSAGYILEKLA